MSTFLTAGALTLCLLAAASPARAQRAPERIAPAALGELREWDARSERMKRNGELRVRNVREDTLVPDRIIERADQYYKGVRVFGADVARQLRGGVLVSIFGNVYSDVSVETSPSIDADRALTTVSARTGVDLGRGPLPELVVLPLDGGRFALTWRLRVATPGDLRQYFVDAHSGDIIFDYSDAETQASVGRALGVLGDTKKISTTNSGGRYTTTDALRPPSIVTLDLKGDLNRTLSLLNRFFQYAPSDVASDDDNNWTDVAVDDAHVYEGWTYDYYFRRFGRHGLDDRDLKIVGYANPVRRDDYQRYPPDVIGLFYLNAFYAGGGVMVYGVGLPVDVPSPAGRQQWDFLSGGLDVVAHELSHGVTEFTSALIYRNESGALNEAFSDIMGTSAEFFYQPPGDGPMRADYLMGEDVIRPGGLRSLADPQSKGDPDHYSKRFLGSADNGGVHTNSTIVSHAFYLAIEGGTNRTSGLTVQGVGGANREQMEKVFYRAFTQLLPSNATFAVARSATIQAARDLYGADSNAERAVTQAWTAVGVN